MIQAKYIIYHDLIGIKASVKHNSMKKDTKFKDIGVIIDDTRNMILAEKDCKVKKYIKKNYEFRFKFSDYMEKREDSYLEVQGSEIIGSPVNRLRSLKKKRWYKK